jgi:hypothetical protein
MILRTDLYHPALFDTPKHSNQPVSSESSQSLEATRYSTGKPLMAQNQHLKAATGPLYFFPCIDYQTFAETRVSSATKTRKAIVCSKLTGRPPDKSGTELITHDMSWKKQGSRLVTEEVPATSVANSGRSPHNARSHKVRLIQAGTGYDLSSTCRLANFSGTRCN